MCAIAGFSGAFEPALLQRMNTCMRHRGPDDEGATLADGGKIGLCHRRLSIIDLSPQGAQPMQIVGGNLWITFNGEIYNYKELRHELEASGHRFCSLSDTEVLLRLYQRYGVEMLPRLNGIFAFALWDNQKRELFLARDQLGVKPLYYACTTPGFLFASEIRALLEEPSLTRTFDTEALTRQLVFLWTPGAGTLLKHVKRLEPGHAMIVRDGRIDRVWRYYTLPRGGEPLGANETDVANVVRETVAAAVRRQMVADVPVSAFLSGGMDSSTVVAFAARHVGRDRLTCFTAATDAEAMRKEGFADDLPYAREVAKHFGVRLHEVHVDAEDFIKAHTHFSDADLPIVDPASLITYTLSKAARDAGFKVMLSGSGGDDVFGGYRRHTATQFEPLFSRLPHGITSGLSKLLSAVPGSSPAVRRARKLLNGADLDQDGRLIARFHWIAPEVAYALTGARQDVDMPLRQALRECGGETDPLERMLVLEKRFFLADHNLAYMDQMGMAASVEIRVPLIDIEVVAAAARIPSHMKLRAWRAKGILKQAMVGHLPMQIINRRKTGFGAPLRQWLSGPLKERVRDTLSPAALKSAGIVNPDVATKLISDHYRDTADSAYTIFALYAIHRWAKAHHIG